MGDLISSPLDVIDLLLLVGGGVVVLRGALRWRRAWPRDPLRGAPLRPNVLSPAWIWLGLLLYGLSILLASSVTLLYAPAGVEGDALARQRQTLGGGVMQAFVILAMLWILRQTFTTGWRGAGLGRRAMARDLADGVQGFLAAFTLCTLIAWLTEVIVLLLAPAADLPKHTVFETLEHPETPWFVGWTAVVGALLLAPWAEELLFRGILQSGLHRVLPALSGSLRHRWVAIVLASLLFGMMHLPVPQHVPALTVLAIILGYQYERTGSLYAPVIVHVLFNGKSLLWHGLG